MLDGRGGAVDQAKMARCGQQAWLLAMVGAFLFALGGVATAAQEFLVWVVWMQVTQSGML